MAMTTISSVEYDFTTTPGDPVPLEVLYKNNMSTTAAAGPVARQIDNLFDEELGEDEDGSGEVFKVDTNEMALVASRHEPIRREGTVSAFTTTFQASTTTRVVVLIVSLFGLY